jgi:hypothetical protein
MILMSSQKNVPYYYPLKLQNPDLGTEEERRGEEKLKVYLFSNLHTLLESNLIQFVHRNDIQVSLGRL